MHQSRTKQREHHLTEPAGAGNQASLSKMREKKLVAGEVKRILAMLEPGEELATTGDPLELLEEIIKTCSLHPDQKDLLVVAEEEVLLPVEVELASNVE